MIPVWGIAAALILISVITRSRTYYVLAAASVFNAAVDHYTTPQDEYLMVVYSSISFMAFAGVAKFGDVNVVRNLVILAAFIFISLVAEYSLAFDTMYFIESGNYEISLTVLTVALLIGAGRGMDKNTTVHRPTHHYHSAFSNNFLYHRASHFASQTKEIKR